MRSDVEKHPVAFRGPVEARRRTMQGRLRRSLACSSMLEKLYRPLLAPTSSPSADVQEHITMIKTIRVRFAGLVAGLLLAATASPNMHAQQLGWEGGTGVFITPLAYTVATHGNRFALPTIGYHYLNGGEVLGTFNQMSITSGFANRVEFGYTRLEHAAGNDSALSPFWTEGFNTFHAKGTLIKENAWKQQWLPQVSVGFTIRSQVKNVGGVTTNKDTTNGDIYFVATKTITQLKPMPIIITGGVRGSNAQLFGLGGNAPGWGTFGFGSVAFVFDGPVKSKIILAAEVSQQPNRIQNLPGAVIPTAMVYALRVLPSPRLPLNVDFGVLHGPGHIAPGVDLKAELRPAFAISYKFGK